MVVAGRADHQRRRRPCPSAHPRKAAWRGNEESHEKEEQACILIEKAAIAIARCNRARSGVCPIERLLADAKIINHAGGCPD